ncbi:MAG: oligosaccharide flippase family protein [Hyphomicrobiaceae bacterium]|nr:oligosaccharide flippase family protein [Hyphomicrobiaceae bacterium]
MSISQGELSRGAIWSIGCYAILVIVRFGTNVILARLLAPELFGIMVIITSVRIGIELISDVGIGQNIVYSKNGDLPEFYNTAWTIQLLRGALLALVFYLAASPLAAVYNIPQQTMEVAALILLFTGATSTSLFLAERKMNFATRNLFDTIVDCIGSCILIAFAYFSPTIWALVIGGVMATMVRAGASYLLPNSKQKLTWSKPFAAEIFSFGKWIFAASIVYFAASNFDRLYLGTAVPLALLGVFGMARAIADLPVTLAQRLNTFLTFPVISKSSHMPRAALRQELTPLRLKFLLATAICLSGGIAVADLFVDLLYDERYHQASWMLPVLLLGVWGTVLCITNDSTLIGLGKPIYGAIANVVKLTYLVVGLPLAVKWLGIFGAVVVVATSDILRYLPLVIGQMRERFAFRTQDLLLSAFMLALLCLWTAVRWAMGFGTAFDGLPKF